MDTQSSKTAKAIRTYFSKLGLDAAVADIYLALYSQGPQNISQLARSSKVERTRIYRLVDQLMESNLIELDSSPRARGIIKAAPVTNLRILINQRQEALKNLDDELELIEQTLARNSLSSPAMRLQTYSGQNGLRQMLWNKLEAGAGSRTIDTNENETKGTVEILSYELRDLENIAGVQLAKQWNEEFNTLVHAGKLSRRCITSSMLAIPNQCDIYSDIVAHYAWASGEFYGTEIYSLAVADGQRQLFELAWNTVATP